VERGKKCYFSSSWQFCDTSVLTSLAKRFFLYISKYQKKSLLIVCSPYLISVSILAWNEPRTPIWTLGSNIAKKQSFVRSSSEHPRKKSEVDSEIYYSDKNCFDYLRLFTLTKQILKLWFHLLSKSEFRTWWMGI